MMLDNRPAPCAHHVTTWMCAAVESGCTVTCAVNLSGQIDAETAAKEVWHLLDQLPP